MNKLSGYKLFRLKSGEEVELKFGNGATELFAGLMGLQTLDEVEAALKMPVRETASEQGAVIETPAPTIAYLRTIRLFVLAGAKYAALAQGKPDDFNEWMVADWIEEIGMDQIFAILNQGAAPEDAAKKKAKTIQPSQ